MNNKEMEKVCKTCGEKFDTTCVSTEYCSHSCYVNDYEQSLKDQGIVDNEDCEFCAGTGCYECEVDPISFI